MNDQPRDGMNVQMHITGERSAEGIIVRGQRHGPWTFWYEDGAVREVGTYVDGVKQGRWLSYWPNHQRKMEGSYENGRKTGFWGAWYDSGSMKMCGEYIDDLENGFWQTWDEQEQMISEGHYKLDERDGSWRFQGQCGDVAYMTEWYNDELTNVPGRPPRQVKEHRGIYYPVVPGQIPGQITPFANPGAASGIFFGGLTSPDGMNCGMGPFSYLFQPVAAMNDQEAAGLNLAISGKDCGFVILERLYTSFPDIPIPESLEPPGCTTESVFVLSDPLATGIRQNQFLSHHSTVEEAIVVAQNAADEFGYRTVVASPSFEYPLGIS